MSTHEKESLIFAAPIIGPKVYIVKGSSGWPETFDRKKLDAELVAFLAPLDLADVVSTFLLSRELAEKPKDRLIAWHTVLGHIARTLGINYGLVPHTVGIAFWAHVLLAMAAAEAN
jgi:hypothetical protein